jgi:hypothetical protein
MYKSIKTDHLLWIRVAEALIIEFLLDYFPQVREVSLLPYLLVV